MTPYNILVLAWIICFVAWAVAIVAAIIPTISYIAVPIIFGSIAVFLSLAIYAMYALHKVSKP